MQIQEDSGGEEGVGFSRVVCAELDTWTGCFMSRYAGILNKAYENKRQMFVVRCCVDHAHSIHRLDREPQTILSPSEQQNFMGIIAP